MILRSARAWCGLIAAFATLPAWAVPPVGLDAVSRLDRLPEARVGVRTLQVSSHDPAGANNDQGYYRYTLNGEYVLLDTLGPGCVYRIWMNGQDANGILRVYLNQSATPAIQMTLGAFFAGTAAPFTAPLVAGADQSSGGSVSYVPIPYATGCRITTSTAGGAYDITYQSFADTTGVTTYSGQEDACPATIAWQYAGLDPKIDTGTQSLSQDLAIPAGQSSASIALPGAGIIQGLELQFDGLQISSSAPITDDGRSGLGTVSFSVGVHPANQGVRLVRRIDYGVCDQHGRVYVNGVLAGDWVTPGAKSGTFANTTFDLPANLTTGQSVLNIQIQYVSSCGDWTEFYYWVQSNVGGQYTQTDYFDVGNLNSESLHHYAITMQNWTGSHTYPSLALSDPSFRDIVQNTRLRIAWDGQAVPAVDAPLALFFGGGTGPALVQALPVGMDTDRLYCYFPMPFATGASIQLINQSSQAISGLHANIKYTPMPSLPADYGRFCTQYRSATPSPGADYVFLDETGTGHLVGIVQSMHNAGAGRTYLEGDERIYVDGSLTPVIYGTGTDAFFNGGGYFDRGTYTLPASGNPVHDTSAGDTTVAYRFFLSDLISFRTAIRAGLEHGPANDVAVDMASVAFYYKQPNAALMLSDQIDVGTAASEATHGYAPITTATPTSLNSTYEGDNDDVAIMDNGQLLPVAGGATFTVHIGAQSGYVLLRRRMDFAVPNQSARVFVNGTLAGTWYDAGANTAHRWRDSDFLIPPALVPAGGMLNIRIENASASANWTEFRYWVYAGGVPTARADFDQDGDVDMEDFGRFQACLSETFGAPIPPECTWADFNGDNYISQADFTQFSNCFSGPNHTPEPGC